MSYQYCSYLYYCDIHLHRYIRCYCQFTYNDSVILIMFYFKLSRKFSFLTNIKSSHLWYFWTQLFAADKEIHNFLFLVINNNFRNQVPVIKPSNRLKREYYWGLAGCCERYLHLDLNCLDSDHLWKYTTVPSQCERFSWTWTWRLLYFDSWYHFENRPGSV